MSATLARSRVVLKWSARILSILLVVLFLLFLIGEGVPGSTGLTLIETAMFSALFVVFLGFVLAWIRELAGGILSLAGFIVFLILEGDLEVGVLLSAMALPSILFIISGMLKRREIRNEPIQVASPGNGPLSS